ncbi:MAG TPA: hypothetical protein VHT73_01905 [Thermodesulfobacteriota bacterium]|nr:hypothetical protein [Thermodesulfobacteriota bacterium]
MRKRNYKKTYFAICIDNGDNPESLTLRRIYRVLPDESAERTECIRVIDDEDEDYIYPLSNFILIEFPSDVERALLEASDSESLD